MLRERKEDWTYEMVEERLIEAALAWKRSPGGGKWPFAGDAPWHLADRDYYGPDVDKNEPLRPLPLVRAEIGRRDEASAWLAYVPERDRRLTAIVVMEKAHRNGRVSWVHIRKTMRIPFGNEGLRRRYDRSITTIAKALTKAGVLQAAA